MSIQDRRNFLQKSSLGIDNIRKSVTKLGEGLSSLSVKTSQLLKQTRQTNELKRKLIRQDAEFFKRRRENALRKQREDELEASTITGVTKRQGSLIQKSTRGFLGRILDFVGILLLGWAVTNLPKIIAAFQKLFGLIKRVVGVLTSFVEGMKRSNSITKLGAYLAMERTKHLKHVLTKGKSKDSIVGNIFCKIIHPIVYLAGNIVKNSNKRGR